MPETRFCPKCGEECGLEDKFCTSCRTELRAPSRPSGARSGGGAADEGGFGQTEMGLPANAVLLNRYKIVKLLGAGGMGRVYLAEDQMLGIPIAIKVLRDILIQDPVAVKRLITEAKTSILLAHPNIVRLHNFEDGETTKFLVMEYVEGETLDTRIANQGKLSEADTRAITVEVCRGLEHAHSKKVIHRDMKPGNVLLGKDGSIKISDFGLARLCHDSIARLTSQLSAGTLQYMSPEQLDGEISELSDQYSVGIMMYEMLSGAPPFVTGDLPGQIRNKVPKPIDGASPEMNRIVARCIDKDKNRRFAGIRKLREELDGTAEQRRKQASQLDQHLESLKSRATAAFNEGRYADAVSLWQQALAIKPDDAGFAGSLQRAQEYLARARQGRAPKPEDRPQPDAERLQRIETLKAKGNEAFAAARYGDAIAAFQEALSLNPGDPALSQALAEARKQADLLIKEAERRKAAEATQQWINEVLERVQGLCQKGSYREAEAMLQQALQHLPNHPQFVEQLNRIRQLLGQERTPMPPQPPKSRRKWWIWGLAGLAILVILGIVGNLMDDGYVPTPAVEKPASGVVKPPEEKPVEPPVEKPKWVPPPVERPRPIDLSGSWNYALTYPNGLVKSGQMLISHVNQQVSFSTTSQYYARNYAGQNFLNYESFEFSGTLIGNLLHAECIRGVWQVNGVPQNFGPFIFNLNVARGGRIMTGMATDQLGQTATANVQR